MGDRELIESAFEGVRVCGDCDGRGENLCGECETCEQEGVIVTEELESE
jgi:hypothetical protein